MILLVIVSCKKNKLPTPAPIPETKGPSDFKVTLVSRDENYAVINWTESVGEEVKYDIELEGNNSKNLVYRDIELKNLQGNKSYVGKIIAHDANGKSLIVTFEIPPLDLELYTFINSYPFGAWVRGAIDGSGFTFWKTNASNSSLIPAISNDIIFISEPNAIAAYNKKTFALIWKKNWEHPSVFGLSLLSYKDKLVLPAKDKLHIINSSDGTTIWTLNEKDYTQPCISKGALYVSNKDVLGVYDLSTGLLKWKFEAGNDIGEPLTKDGTVYFVGSEGIFYALNSENGTVKWKNNFTSTFTGNAISMLFGHRPSVMGNKVYFLYNAVSPDRYNPSLYARAVDVASGTTIWTVKVENSFGGFLVTNENLGIFVGANNYAYQLEPETGKVKWGGFGCSGYRFTVVENQIYHQYSVTTSALVFRSYSRNVIDTKWATPNGDGLWACPVVVVRNNKVYYPAESAMNWIE